MYIQRYLTKNPLPFGKHRFVPGNGCDWHISALKVGISRANEFLDGFLLTDDALVVSDITIHREYDHGSLEEAVELVRFLHSYDIIYAYTTFVRNQKVLTFGCLPPLRYKIGKVMHVWDSKYTTNK